MLLKNLAILLLSFYKFAISPYILSQCCYAISCSDYSKIIIKEKGIILGYSNPEMFWWRIDEILELN